MSDSLVQQAVKALRIKPASTANIEYHVRGTVADIKDGRYLVHLGSSTATTACSRYCDASKGDQVLVLVMPDGLCAAVARLMK